ncbi:accessory factor UbiK family protein [Beggiatoa leptomitoformis]|uniref:Ubiquinone biosynthesis accessory factor UbiK n=1 Tax=Beggiatoa leptomitoformis TaxID=288004 RepID=A0A2N9YFK0_9GAMM|nr:accessory factor UbiK family protein [Beggiatoa leptomitoformis]ALG68368.1 accessory factor UbiK family protein [Beggiatoa leptomitoformis]AUI69311.1 accessory factor UbiK family protein [Beggiatoa leptomitoformis]
MLNPNHFEALFKEFVTALPKGAIQLQQDAEKNLRLAMEATFRRMNLVTREEFDVQTAVLARTRAKLEALEATVAQLEARQASETHTPFPPAAME